MGDSTDLDRKEDLKWIHQRLTDQVDREFELIGQRLTWLITGNAFLFTTFAISMNSNSSALKPYLIFSAAFLGLLLCFVAHVSIKVARNAIGLRKESRTVVEDKIKIIIGFYEDVTVSRKNRGHKLGNIFYVYLPFSISLIWNVLALKYIDVLNKGGSLDHLLSECVIISAALGISINMFFITDNYAAKVTKCDD